MAYDARAFYVDETQGGEKDISVKSNKMYAINLFLLDNIVLYL